MKISMIFLVIVFYALSVDPCGAQCLSGCGGGGSSSSSSPTGTPTTSSEMIVLVLSSPSPSPTICYTLDGCDMNVGDPLGSRSMPSESSASDTPQLDSIINSLDSLSSAESQIRDSDFAKEASNMARESQLIQEGLEVLALANQSPQNVLAILR